MYMSTTIAKYIDAVFKLLNNRICSFKLNSFNIYLSDMQLVYLRYEIKLMLLQLNIKSRWLNVNFFFIPVYYILEIYMLFVD